MASLLLFLFLLQPPDEPAKRADALVGQLSAKSFRLREEACAELEKIGLSALAAVEKGIRSADAETRDRCRKLMESIPLADLEGRLGKLLADKEGTGKHDLPGWERFRKEVDGTPAGKAFYAKMLRKNPKATYLYQRDAAGLVEFLVKRRQEIIDEKNQMAYRPQATDADLSYDLHEICFWLLASSEQDIRKLLAKDDRPHNVADLLYHNVYCNELHNARSGIAPEKLFALWMGSFRKVDGDQADLETGIDFARGYRLKIVLEIAITWADARSPARLAGAAMSLVGKFGDATHLPLLAKFLDDTRSFPGLGRREPAIQCRDVALAMSLHLQAQEPHRYGFERLADGGDSLFFPRDMGLNNDSNRRRAFEMYADFLRK